jgi:hypothetical protein
LPHHKLKEQLNGSEIQYLGSQWFLQIKWLYHTQNLFCIYKGHRNCFAFIFLFFQYFKFLLNFSNVFNDFFLYQMGILNVQYKQKSYATFKSLPVT